MGDARFVHVPGREPRGTPDEKIAELARRLNELSSAISALTKAQMHIQATEPNIGPGKLVIWRDTTGAATYLVVNVSGTQYKVQLL